MLIKILILFSTLLISQNYDSKSIKLGLLKGEIVDESNNFPVKYATIKLFRSSDSTLVDGTISEEDGFFILKDLKPGKYNLSVEHVMYETFILADQLLAPPETNKNLGFLKLKQRMLEVEGVNIVDEKPFVQEEIDKKVYNIEDMPIAASGTAEDVLSSLPSVTVGADGEVSFRGNESVNIMIDGRMKSATNLDVLDAVLIEKVEVIAIPSAKYDPDGTAGIINIITKKNEYVGSSGKTTFGFDNFGSNSLSITSNYFKDKLNLYGTFSKSNRKSEGYKKRYRELLDNSQNYFITEGYNRYIDVDRNRKNQNLKFGLEFYPEENRIIYCDLSYSDFIKSDYELELTRFIENNIESNTLFEENIYENEDGFERSLVAGYVIKLENGREITLENNSEFDQETEFERTNEKSVSNNEKRNGYRFKIDYTHPFESNVPDKKNLIEAGFLDKQYGYNNLFDYNNDSTNTNTKYDFSNSRSILASYIDVSYYIKPQFSLKFGFRLENAIRNFKANSTEIIQNIESNTDFYKFLIDQQSENNSFNKTYSTIYPSLFLNYDLKEKGNIKFGFGRRVERPGDWLLTPLPRSIAENNQIHIGNPIISPEDIFKYEISYSNRIKIGYLSSTFFVSTIKNAFDWDMDRYIFDEDENTFIQDDSCIENCFDMLTHDNIAEKDEYGFEVFVMTRPMKKWDLKFGGDISFGKFKSDTDESDQNGNTSSTSLFANSNFKIKDNLKLDINTWMWMSKLTDGKIYPMSGTNLALKYDFKSKFSIVFRIKDLFDSQKLDIKTSNTFTSNNISYTNNMDFERQRRARSFGLSIDYRFGDYKENKFKKDRQYDNGGGSQMMGY
tara:strand:- start:2422 stop:4947 length:2526 start_codon:yes stop_codon:yes gene_type:complete